MLGEAYLAAGAFEKGAAIKGAAICKEALIASDRTQFALGMGLSTRSWAELPQAQGESVLAKRELLIAAELFAAVGAEFELARTRLELADVDRIQQR